MLARHARLLLAAALLAGAPLAAQPALTGPELFVDPTSRVPYEGHAAATDATGRLLVVWIDSREIPNRLRGRVFGASGTPERPAFTLGTGDHPMVGVTLAPAEPDGFLITWRTSEKVGPATKLRFFARRLSPSGRPRGGVLQIHDPLLTVQGFPAIGPMRTASAPDGSFVAAWEETNRRTRRLDVFLRRFDATGRPLAKAAPIPNEGGTRERSLAALTVLTDGEIRIAWWSRRAESQPSSLWLRRFARNGVPLAAPVRLRPGAASWSSSVAFGPDGGGLVVWGGGYRAFAPDGTLLPGHPPTVALWDPQVTPERGGTFLVSGSPWDTSSPFPFCGVAGIQLEADGTPRGPAGCLSNPASGGSDSATGTADGGFALFWTADQQLIGQRLATASPGTLQIERARAAILESSTEPLQLRILRRDGTDGAVSVDYQLAGAAGGSGTVTFPDGDSNPRIVEIPVSDDAVPANDRTVGMALLRPTGGAVLGLPQQAVVEIRDDDEPSPLLARAEPSIEVAYGDGRDTELWDPDLAVSPGGAFEVVWGYSYRYRYTDPVRYDYAVQGQLFDTAAHPTTAIESSCPGGPDRSGVARHPEGDSLVYWNVGGSGFARIFDALGKAGPEIPLAFPFDDVAALPQGRFVAAGRGHDAAGDGLFVHFLAAGGTIDRSVLLTRRALLPGSASAVASDGSGRVVAVWSAASTGDGPAGLFARRFDALGAPLGPAVRVSPWENRDSAPSVAMDPQGNFAVAWQRIWDGHGTGVYARAFTSTGAPLTGEIPVNSTTAGNQKAPSLAWTGDGRFAVLWQVLSEDPYEDSSQVAGQLFARDGTRLGGEAEIDPDGADPVISWSDQGLFVAAYGWNGASIAARRLPV